MESNSIEQIQNNTFLLEAKKKLKQQYEILKNILKILVDIVIQLYIKAKNLIFSSETFKKILSIFIFGLILLAALTFSIAAYCIFYYNYIPKVGQKLPCYFQYSNITNERITEVYNNPKAIVDLTTGTWKKNRILTGGQYYNILLELKVEETAHNYNLGNFMVKLELKNSNDVLLATENKPCIVKYKSMINKNILSILKLFPMMLDLMDESQIIKLPLINKYLEDEREKYSTSKAIVYLSNKELRLYSANLIFETQYYGLRYYMYHYKISTAVLIILIIMFWESTFLFITWKIGLKLTKEVFNIKDKTQ